MWPFKRSANVEEKASAVSPLIVLGMDGIPKWTPRQYDKLAEEGYQRNVIAYRAIDDISKSAASAPWKLFRRTNNGREEIADHEILNLIHRPNPTQSWTFMVYEIISYLQIAGNSYLEAVSPINGYNSKTPQELWVKRPDRMKVIPDSTGVAAYEYEVSGQKHRWDVDMMTQQADILHLPLFHPLDDWYGMSPIEVAASGIDIHNQFSAWNLSLMQNNAKPSGILSTEGRLDETQIKGLKKEIEGKWSGSVNSGKPMVLGAGLKWQQMSFSPQDLDWINGKDTTARDICHAFGYPPFLLGLPGNSTFNNMEMAKLWLWENTVFFYLNFLRDELNTWLLPRYQNSENLKLDYDISQVPALASRRNAERQKAKELEGIATINERRAIVGLAPVDGGDIIPMPVSMIPLGDLSSFGDEESEKQAFIKALKAEGYEDKRIDEMVKAGF